MERKPIRDNRPSEERYNSELTMQELMFALGTCKASSPGPDSITYTMIQNLHPDTLETLLYLYNKIWLAGRFPTSWREAIVVAILKEGKDASLPTSYWPIALTSCLSKVFEKMITRRLTYFLEYNGILDNCQAGFRSGRCTTDQLVAFESFVKDAFIHKQLSLCIF